MDFSLSATEHAELTEHNLKKNIVKISQLFNKLLAIYKSQFSNDVLWLVVPSIDIVKINLFKNAIVEILKDYLYIKKLHHDFFDDFIKEYLLLYSYGSKSCSDLVCLLLKKYWLKSLDHINTMECRDKRKLTLYFNNWLNNLAKQENLLINSQFELNNILMIKNNFFIIIKKWLNDLIINKGYLDIKFHNNSSFKIGDNLAASPGTVIYKNELMELIQYSPTTLQVFKVPLLFVPPCINKYYILDLSSNNSLVKWMVNQGFTVYMISWINPTASLAHKTFADYIINGPLQALDVIADIIQVKKFHLAGYCMGGTMLSCVLSYIQQTKKFKIMSATHFMSLINFANFKNLNQDYLNKLEIMNNKTGYMAGKLLSMAFNIVHANELVWPYFVNYYLFNQSLDKFDTLYWNCDSINLPAGMYNFYVRNICFENKLCQTNAITINGVAIDISKVTAPIFFVAGEQDHISPWEISYSSLRLYSSSVNKQFILAAGGHVNGLINCPTNAKYSYKCIDKTQINELIANDIHLWINNTNTYAGSWWPCWLDWLKKIESTQITVTSRNFLAISFQESMLSTNAPGTYVHNSLK